MAYTFKIISDVRKISDTIFEGDIDYARNLW